MMRGSREVNLPAGVDPVAGGCGPSDLPQHDGKPGNRGDADSLQSSLSMGEGGESVNTQRDGLKRLKYG